LKNIKLLSVLSRKYILVGSGIFLSSCFGIICIIYIMQGVHSFSNHNRIPILLSFAYVIFGSAIVFIGLRKYLLSRILIASGAFILVFIVFYLLFLPYLAGGINSHGISYNSLGDAERMFAVSAIGFLFSALSLYLVSSDSILNAKKFLINLSVSLTVAYAFWFLFVLFFGYPVVFEDGKGALVEISAVAGMFFIGLFVLCVNNLGAKKNLNFPDKIMPFVSGVSLFFALLLWTTSVKFEDSNLQNNMKDRTKHLGDAIDARLQENFLAIKRMSERWNRNESIDVEGWRHDAGTYLSDLPGLVSIVIVKNEKDLFLEESKKYDRRILQGLLSVFFAYPHPYSGNIKSINNLQTFSSLREIDDAGMFFIYYSLDDAGGSHPGLMIGIFSINEFIKRVIAKNRLLISGKIIVSIYHHNQIVYQNSRSAGRVAEHMLLTVPDDWRVRVELSDEDVYYKRSKVPDLILAGGILIVVMIAMLSYFWSREILNSQKHDKLKVRAENANRAKSEFLSSVSHELRTPMNAILGFAQILNMQKTLNKDQHMYIDIILDAGRHLLTLINDILDLSKIESGRMDLKMDSIESDQIVEHSIQLLKPMAKSNNIKINCDDHIKIKIAADLDKARQVFINILTNAIKYNRKNGAVDVKREIQGNRLKISVTDSGQGIPPDKIKIIFKPFIRLNSKEANVEGTGIGLTISRRLMKLMRGKIGCHSVPGAGSTFWIEFVIPEKQKYGP